MWQASTRNVQAIFECGGADIIIDAILSGKSSPTQKSALIRVLVGMIANEHFAGIITRRCVAVLEDLHMMFDLNHDADLTTICFDKRFRARTNRLRS